MFTPTANDRRNAFTLVELLVAITILSILASIVLFGMAGMQNLSKIQRTKAQIAKIHELIAEKWESYEYVSVKPTGNLPIDRLNAIREYIKYELPDRITDVVNHPSTPTGTVTGIPRPALNGYYVSRARPTWTGQFQGSECLYMIISRMEIGDASALELFAENEIGDVDGDGMPEILDAWGNPIEFLRWAPAFGDNRPLFADASPVPRSDFQGPNVGPDPFDVANADDRVAPSDLDPNNDTFILFPLVFSAGPDGRYEIITDTIPALVYWRTAPPDAAYANDPFAWFATGDGPVRLGQIQDATSNGHVDNIYNHLLETSIR